MEKDIEKTLDLERTDKLFGASIVRSEALSKKDVYNEDDIKRQRLVIGFGNLHINTARVKMSAIRMAGYRDNIGSLKRAVERKVRNSKKYGSNAD